MRVQGGGGNKVRIIFFSYIKLIQIKVQDYNKNHCQKKKKTPKNWPLISPIEKAKLGGPNWNTS